MAVPVSEVTFEFGRRVRARRVELGFSQERFAEVCGVDRSYMGHIERGEKNVTLHTMVALCVGLGADLGELTTGLAELSVD